MKSIVLRRAVWNNNVSKTSMDGKCNLCGYDIYYESFICWCINLVEEINVKNFIAICKRCECYNRKFKQPTSKILRTKGWRLFLITILKVIVMFVMKLLIMIIFIVDTSYRSIMVV